MKFCKVEICLKPVFGGGYCKNHQYLRTKSEEQEKYKVASKAFREEGKGCEIKSPVCIGKIQGVHHVKSRGKNLNNKATWMRSCNPCNQWIEQHDKEARELGLKESKFKKDE